MTAADPVAGRRSDLEALADGTWDVVIVGGGIVGSGALLDAVSRGMRAVLIEQDDIASGTSSRSSRLIHGGLRYLEQFRFGLVREALAERSRLLDLAPHLVRLEPLLFPIYGIPFATKAFYDAGLTLYDILGARHDGGWHRRLSKGATLELAPTLRTEGLRGGLLYHDGVEDDARYTLAVARTAVAAGGVAVTRVRATGLRAGSDRGLDRGRPGAGHRDRRRLRDPDHGRRGRHRRLGGQRRPPVRRRLAAHPAEPRRAPRRATRPHPEHGRADDPRARQDRLPRPVAGALADRHHRRAVRGPDREPRRRRLGGDPSPRHRERDDGRRPAARGRGRHVRRAAAADRPLRRLDGQGVARAPRVEARRTASCGSPAASTRPTG